MTLKRMTDSPNEMGFEVILFFCIFAFAYTFNLRVLGRFCEG